ncbi:MAG: PAS domain-containing protein, partial [Anaerolineae bacterium]|nr:PAS domain-containing protein [Anaerolineae bacterium]
MRALLQRFDIRVSVAYGLVATLWIVLSDLILAAVFAGNLPVLTALSTVKGLLYVLVTTLGLYIVLHAELRKHQQLETALQQDIAERQRMEVALRESEQRFRNMADTAPAMLWITDLDGRTTFLSRRWCEFTGQTEASGLSWGWLDALHPEDRDEIRDAFLSASKTRGQFQVEYRLHRHVDDEYRWVIALGTPRYSDAGQFQGYIGSVVDV